MTVPMQDKIVFNRNSDENHTTGMFVGITDDGDFGAGDGVHMAAGVTMSNAFKKFAKAVGRTYKKHGMDTEHVIFSTMFTMMCKLVDVFLEKFDLDMTEFAEMYKQTRSIRRKLDARTEETELAADEKPDSELSYDKLKADCDALIQKAFQTFKEKHKEDDGQSATE